MEMLVNMADTAFGEWNRVSKNMAGLDTPDYTKVHFL